MKKVFKAAGRGLTRAIAFGVDLYRRYPARANSYIASAIVFLAGLCGLVVNQQSILVDVALIAPVLVSGEVSHRKVTPAK